MKDIENSPIRDGGDTGVIAAELFHPNDVSKLSHWDIDFRQLEPGPMRTKVVTRSGSQLSILEMSLDRSVHQVGQSPANAATFAIASEDHLASWRGSEVSGSPLLDFGQGADFDAVNTAGFRGLTISVPIEALQSVAHQTGLPMPTELPRVASRLADPGGPETSLVEGMARAALSNPESCFNVQKQMDLVAHLLTAVSADQTSRDKISSRLRERVLRRALDVMNSCAEDSLSIGEICAASDASWRTLNRAFNERFGVGPKAYYQRLRLTRVHTDLSEGGPGLLVADIANAYGFWHMGQFAKDYYAMFGELPSETMKLND